MRRHAYTSQRSAPVKGGNRNGKRQSASPGGGRGLYAALFFSAMLLFGFDLANFRLADGVRGLITDISLPVLEVSSQAISSTRSLLRTTRDYSDLADRYEKLRTENLQLRSLRSEALVIKARARAYEALLAYVPEDGSEWIAARTVADVQSPFSRSVIVNAGASRGVANGSAVLGEAGFVGRVVSTGNTTSRVLLVTDINSRIPVFVGAARYRALLAGTNGPSLSLLYLPPSAILNSGDPVITSGEARLLPQGLAIGRVRLGPDGELDVVVGQPPGEAEIVRILKYDAQVDVDSKTTPLPVALKAAPDAAAMDSSVSEGDEVQTAVAVKAGGDLLPARE